MKRILLVRLSSLGDVLHTFPAVTDLARARPERSSTGSSRRPTSRSYACTPAIAHAIPFALRRWRRGSLRAAVWREISRVPPCAPRPAVRRRYRRAGAGEECRCGRPCARAGAWLQPRHGPRAARGAVLPLQVRHRTGAPFRRTLSQALAARRSVTRRSRHRLRPRRAATACVRARGALLRAAPLHRARREALARKRRGSSLAAHSRRGVSSACCPGATKRSASAPSGSPARSRAPSSPRALSLADAAGLDRPCRGGGRARHRPHASRGRAAHADRGDLLQLRARRGPVRSGRGRSPFRGAALAARPRQPRWRRRSTSRAGDSRDASGALHASRSISPCRCCPCGCGWRGRREPGYRRDVGQRFGRYGVPPRPAGDLDPRGLARRDARGAAARRERCARAIPITRCS